MYNSEYRKLIKLNLWVYGSFFVVVFIIGIIFEIGNSFIPAVLAYLSFGYMPFVSLNAVLSKRKTSHHHRSPARKKRPNFSLREFKMLFLQLLLLGILYLLIYKIFGTTVGKQFLYCCAGLIVLNLLFIIIAGNPFRKKTNNVMGSKDFYYLYSGIGTLMSLGFCYYFYYYFSASQ